MNCKLSVTIYGLTLLFSLVSSCTITASPHSTTVLNGTILQVECVTDNCPHVDVIKQPEGEPATDVDDCDPIINGVLNCNITVTGPLVIWCDAVGVLSSSANINVEYVTVSSVSSVVSSDLLITSTLIITTVATAVSNTVTVSSISTESSVSPVVSPSGSSNPLQLSDIRKSVSTIFAMILVLLSVLVLMVILIIVHIFVSACKTSSSSRQRSGRNDGLTVHYQALPDMEDDLNNDLVVHSVNVSDSHVSTGAVHQCQTDHTPVTSTATTNAVVPIATNVSLVTSTPSHPIPTLPDPPFSVPLHESQDALLRQSSAQDQTAAIFHSTFQQTEMTRISRQQLYMQPSEATQDETRALASMAVSSEMVITQQSQLTISSYVVNPAADDSAQETSAYLLDPIGEMSQHNESTSSRSLITIQHTVTRVQREDTATTSAMNQNEQ